MTRPDLLYREAPLAPSGKGLHEAMTFGFARGVEETRLMRLARPGIGETTFVEESFAQDLFLSKLVQSSFPLVADGRIVDGDAEFFQALLVAPPKERADAEFRQAILKELMEDADRRHLVEKAYLSTKAFREALSGADHVQGRTVGVQRRIDILAALKRAVLELGGATGSSNTGLETMALWADQVTSGEPFKALTHLLEFENGRSVLETRLSVGYDGSLRRFELANVTEVQHNAFPRGPFSRFFRRCASFLKGYRFSEEDVMSHVLDHVFSDLEEVVVTVLGLSLQLEFYLRGLAFAEQSKKKGLDTCLAEVLAKGETRRERKLIDLFNPWLVHSGADPVVPCSLAQDDACCTIIVTGPNSGGKTRLMQSLAIAQLLAQVGLPVPAKEATVVEVEQLFLSLLEQAEPNQKEGRLGLELMRIRAVFESCGPHALVIMDELCSGTNPSEGEHIFKMVLELLGELGPQVLITTHFLDFATRLADSGDARTRFLQVELGEQDVPTYQFVPGVAQTSLARNTAARLGVTTDELRSLIVQHRRGAH